MGAVTFLVGVRLFFVEVVADLDVACANGSGWVSALAAASDGIGGAGASVGGGAGVTTGLSGAGGAAATALSGLEAGAAISALFGGAPVSLATAKPPTPSRARPPS